MFVFAFAGGRYSFWAISIRAGRTFWEMTPSSWEFGGLCQCQRLEEISIWGTMHFEQTGWKTRGHKWHPYLGYYSDTGTQCCSTMKRAQKTTTASQSTDRPESPQLRSVKYATQPPVSNYLCRETVFVQSHLTRVLICYSPKCLLHQNSFTAVLAKTWAWNVITSATTFSVHKKGLQHKPE